MNLKGKIENIQGVAGKTKVSKERCVNAVAEDLGISTAEAEAIVDEAIDRLQITYTDFRMKEFWKLSKEEQDRKYEKMLARQEKRKDKSKDKSIKLVCQQSGWDYETARAAIVEAQKRTGCRYVEYYEYCFWNKDKKSQGTYFFRDESHKIGARYDNKLFAQIAKNKSLANGLFADYMRRNWCLNRDKGLAEFKKLFGGTDRIIYKPLKGHQGRGVRVFEFNEDNAEEVYNEIMSLNEGIVEEYVYQHPEMKRLNPSSVNTLRFVTVSWTKRRKLNIDMPYATVRIGNGGVVDNMHGGGMGAALDLETGKICTEGADADGNVYEVHPASGVTIKGFEIPMFESAKNFVLEIIRKFEITGYIGWDIAVTEEGPILIEINTNPSADVLNIPYVHMNKGMKHVMKKYMG